MARTRGAILAATEACVAESGARATTMSSVAVRGRVAKATLYNHFRTKSELLEAVILARIEACRTTALAAPDLRTALRLAATTLRGLPAVAGLVQHDPAALARLTVASDGPASAAARAAVTEVLARHGRTSDAAASELVLRWLVSQLLWTGSAAEADLATSILAAGLPVAGEPTSAPSRDSMEPE